MERLSFVLRIEPERYEEYVKRHRHVFPELQEAFQEVGIHTYSIFYYEGLLFNYLEAENVEQTMKALEAYSVHQRWQQFMSDLLLTCEDQSISKFIPEVYHFKHETNA